MIRMLASLALAVLANAVGLLAAAALVDGFTIDGVSFVVAVGVFSLSIVVLGPLVMKIALKHANYLMGGIALVTTLVGLIITDFFTEGISITGLNSWVLSTLIVWLFSIIGSLLLPLFIFKNVLSEVKENRQDANLGVK